jgi:magnesium transporter
VINVLVHENGATRRATAVDQEWLRPNSPAIFWVDIVEPEEAERVLLSDVFHFHELAVEDAMSEVHHPKIESYDGYLYLILHGIRHRADRKGFETQDVDFFLGPNYLVTVRHAESTSVDEEMRICASHPDLMAGGPANVLHRIVDKMVDHYRPEIDALEDRLEKLEHSVFEEPRVNPLKGILAIKRDISSLRRVSLPQRDAIGRLARREFPQIADALAYRFRDVFDNLVRITDEAAFFQDRVTGLLDAYLSTQSNRLNQVMKVLTVIATVFMVLTVLTGMYGMNVPLPHFPGGPHVQFWWVIGIMAVLSAGMLWIFRRVNWL